MLIKAPSLLMVLSPSQANSANTVGGGLYITSAGSVGTVNINNSATFSGNTPQGIYLAAGSALNLNPPAGSVIDIQDGVASDANINNLIQKTGSGIWQISGTNSTGYRGKTNINGGAFQLQPAAVYGTITQGAVTIGPGGTLAFNVEGPTLPHLYANSITFSGDGSTTSVVSVAGSPTANVSGTVATSNSGSSIKINGSTPATAGLILNRIQTPLYNATFLFQDPNNLNLILSLILPNPNSGGSDSGAGFHEISIAALEGNQSYINLARVLDSFDMTQNQGALANYILAIEANPQYTLPLIGALVPEPQEASFTALQMSVENFWNQIDMSQSGSDSYNNQQTNSALNTSNRRILLASADKKIPFSPWSSPPWIGWGQILGGRGRLNPFNGNNSYENELVSISTGIDRALNRNWRLGGGC